MALITILWPFQIETSINDLIKPRIDKMGGRTAPSW